MGARTGASAPHRSNASAPSPPAWRGNGRRRGDGDGSCVAAPWPARGRPGRADRRYGIVGGGMPCPAEWSNRQRGSHGVHFQHLGGDEIRREMRDAELHGREDGARTRRSSRASALPCRRRRFRPGNRSAASRPAAKSNSIAKQPTSFLDTFRHWAGRHPPRWAIRDGVSARSARNMGASRCSNTLSVIWRPTHAIPPVRGPHAAAAPSMSSGRWRRPFRGRGAAACADPTTSTDAPSRPRGAGFSATHPWRRR